jgi:hypothetical protein
MTTPARDAALRLLALRYAPDQIANLTRDIHAAVLRDSPRLRQGNFEAIAAADLALLFDLYDGRFFAGQMRELLRLAAAPLSFDLSARLTRSAGLTKRFTARPGGAGAAPSERYEITLSTALLYQTFQDVERTVRVNGLVCRDRLEAAQRVFEHELVHLAEMLVCGQSSCNGERFKGLAWGWFAHPETKHDLVTQHERAQSRYDVRVGDRVTFVFEGAPYAGVVNRITRRATVLVEDARGQPYSDGKRYLKFYIPLPMLQKA